MKSQLREYPTDLNGQGSQLTVPTLHNEEFMECAFTMPAPCRKWLDSSLPQH